MIRLLLLLLVLAQALASAAFAHGPTVEITAKGVEPVELVLERGQKLHFHNADTVAHRVRGDDDAFRSPVLAPGGGWHLPFLFPGRFAYELEEHPGSRGVIVVEDAGR